MRKAVAPDAPTAGETRLIPQPGGQSRPSSRGGSTGLPADLLNQSASRLYVLALLYAFIFFMAGYFPALTNSADRNYVFSSFPRWGPGVMAIIMSLAVAMVVRSSRVPLSVVMNLGLGFEVASSYGIAAAEFLDANIFAPNTRWIGLSWVSVWVLLFTVVVPTPPRRAVLAALAAVSAVPVLVGIGLVIYPGTISPSPLQFFFWIVFPYLLVVLMAYVGARVVYALGTEVTRARELGSYRLVERLGEGGMGEVWRARHRLLARPAAIKLIRPVVSAGAWGGGSDDARKRFEREAQAIASLRSPHTVTLFDFGVAADGAFYYVMELLDGVDASTLIRRFGPIPYDRVVHIVRQMCHSLSEADASGLIHRDIKPANVFLCRYGEEFDFVKVLDFGLVKPPNEGVEVSAMTRDNVVPGTPGFMAPEQALGSLKLDGRVDIYATGCVAYWLLTGHQVFSADTPMGLLLHHAHTAPAPPSSRTELPIPAELDRIVMSCLEKNPDARPQSARVLSSLLAEVPGAHGWTAAHARAWWTTNMN